MTRLSKFIREHQITQAELARRTGLNFRTVNYSCRVGVQTARLAKIYAKALNCNPLELIEL